MSLGTEHRASETGFLAVLAERGVRGVNGIAGFVGAHWRFAIMLATLPPVAVYIFYLVSSGAIFWDFRVYQTGIAAYQAIGTPYDAQYLLAAFGQEFAFTSPPIIVLLLSKASWLLTNPASLGVLLALHLAAWFLIPYLLLPHADRPPSREAGWIYGAFLFALGFLGTRMFASGNATAVVSCVCIAALLLSIRLRSYLLFWIVLILACQVKFLFITLAIVPFLMDRKIWQPALVVIIVAGIYGANYIIAPELAHGFAQALSEISTSPTYVGQGVMGAVQAFLRETQFVAKPLWVPISLAVHGCYALLLLTFAASLMWGKARPRDEHMAFLWALTAAMLASPRIIDNDVAIILIPYIVFFRAVFSARGAGFITAGVALAFGLSLTRTALSDWSALVAILGAWIGIGIDWILRERPLNRQPRTALDAILRTQRAHAKLSAP